MAELFAEIILETPRLALRRWKPSDLALWDEHLNTPEVKAFLGGVQTSEELAERFAKVEQAWDRDGFSFLAVERREDRVFLGTCGIARIETACAPDDVRGAIQIGWQFRADSWGQGYATEAAEAVLDMAFGQLDLPVVIAQTSEDNRGSWRVMEKLGMTRRAELDYDDPDYPPANNPTMVWSIGRREWASR